MKVLLTGGTGFIGSYIALDLASAGHLVRIAARNPEKVPALKEVSGIEIVKAPMNDHEALTRAVSDCDALIHAALCWGDSGPEMIMNETMSSVRLIDIAVNAGIKKIIYTSSTAACGYSHRITSEKSLLVPEDFYGATKGSVELFCSAYSQKHPNICINVIRPGYTFGEPVVPGGSMENDSRFIDICDKVQKGNEICLVRNDGTQFIHASDLAILFRKVLESGRRRETYFGLGSKFISWQKIASLAAGLCKKDALLRIEDRGYPDDPFIFDVSKINDDFGLNFIPDAKIENHLKFLLKR